MRQHGASLVRNIENISMALLALGISDVFVGLRPVPRPVIALRTFRKMSKNVLGSVPGFGKKEVESIVRRRQMTVHAISDYPSGIVGMRRDFPVIVGGLNLVAAGAKVRRRCPYHRVIRHTEQWKGNNDPGHH